MDAAQIIHDLTHYDGLPVDAIRAADTDRGALVPVFLEEIERYLAASPEGRAEPNPLFFVFHLLGSWRETSAYRPLARFLRCPPDDLEHVLGDCITETSHRVMAAVFDGDPQPLYDAILDAGADEFVRSRMCEALAMVTVAGRFPRMEAVRFLERCYDDLEPTQDCFAWNGWQSAIAILGASELSALVKQAFQRGSVDDSWLEFKHFEQDLKNAVANPDAPFPDSDGEYTLFGDVIEEMSTWSASQPEPESHGGGRAPVIAWADRSGTPAVNPFRHVGRNDPCPCGSGKKFKKCCLNRVQDGSAGEGEGRRLANWR